jgi:hypothetical protein
MSLRFTIGLCAIILGASSLTLCQPPRPRIAGVEIPPVPTVNNVEAKDIFTASNQAERVIQVRDLDDPLSNFSKRSR